MIPLRVLRIRELTIPISHCLARLKVVSAAFSPRVQVQGVWIERTSLT